MHWRLRPKYASNFSFQSLLATSLAHSAPCFFTRPLKKHRKNCECCPGHSLSVMVQVSQFVIIVIVVIVVICEIEIDFQNCRIWQNFWRVGQKLMDGLSILHGEFLCRNALPAVFSYLWFTWFEYVRNKKLRAYPLLNKHFFYLLLTCFFFNLGL